MVRDGIRHSWLPGEWTEQALCILDSYLTLGKIDLLDIASRFQKWLQDDGRGCGNLTRNILTNNVFLVGPTLLAKDFWETTGKNSASNGAVMRTSVIGLPYPEDLDWTEEKAALVASMTHTDPRCIASSVAVSIAIAMSVCNRSLEYILTESSKRAAKYHSEAPEWMTKSLEDLDLGRTMNGIGYTYKTLGAGFWALRECKSNRNSFENILQQVILEGGDAGTNAAVAGSLLGAFLGFDRILPILIEGLRNRNRLDSSFQKLSIKKLTV